MQRILLASHGTPGAQAAERAALGRLTQGDILYHLMVVPDFWDGMQGDDWLNNAATRDVFADYVETRLADEVKTEFTRLQNAAQKLGVVYESRMTYGKPDACLLEAIADVKPDYVITGAPRPRHQAGQRSRMLTDYLLRTLVVPLCIQPYPAEK